VGKSPSDKVYRAKVSTDAKKSAKSAIDAAIQLELALVTFRAGSKEVEFNFDLTGETIWATQQQIADAFEPSQYRCGTHPKHF
jgi:uncharacterized protein YabE (DUF348 family)